jgi:ribonuclease HI
MNTNINVYTDGSLIRKGKEIFCGYGIYFPNGEYKSISRPFIHTPITNNRAELYAILKTINLCNIINKNRILNKEIEIKTVNIYSDSEYSIKTFNEWLPKWKKNKKPYLNSDIIDEIDDFIQYSPFKINFIHIYAHTNKNDAHSIANSKADELAKNGAKKEVKKDVKKIIKKTSKKTSKKI